MKYLRSFREMYGRRLLIAVSIFAGLLLLFSYHAGNLSHGVTNHEIQTLAEYSSFHSIVHNPLNLPYKLVAWALWHLPYHSVALLRLPAAIFGTLSLVGFAYVVRRWYGLRSAVFGIILFATSSWFLHVSRIALYDVEVLWAITTLISLNVLFHNNTQQLWVFIAWVVGLATLLFVPGMIWLILLCIFLQREDIRDHFDEQYVLWPRIVLPVILFICMTTLGLTFYRHPQLALLWSGIPHHMGNWFDIVKRLADSIVFFILRGPYNPELWLGRLPLLDAFMSVMFIAGAIFYGQHVRAPRTQLLALSFLVGAVLTALRTDISFSILVPIAYLVATAGISYILHEWLHVFPRNPLARGLGIGIVSLLVFMSCFYNGRSYFVAWPHDTETRTYFNDRLIP